MSSGYLSLEEDTKKTKPFGSIEDVRGRRNSGVRVRITPVTVPSSSSRQQQVQPQQRGGSYDDDEFMLASALQPWSSSPGGKVTHRNNNNSFSNRDDSTSYNGEEGVDGSTTASELNHVRQSMRRPSLLDHEDSAVNDDDMRTGGGAPHPINKNNNTNYQIPNLISWQSFTVKVGLFLLTMVAIYGAGIATGLYIRGTPSDAAPRISQVVSSSSSNTTTNGTSVPALSSPSGVEVPSSPTASTTAETNGIGNAAPASSSSSTSSPTQPPTIADDTMVPNSNNSSTNLLVGAYYYPWYGNNFHSGQGYLRSQLVPPQYPTLGEYDDTLPVTIQQHLTWSRQANIGLWVT
jgi:hypothetical protein